MAEENRDLSERLGAQGVVRRFEAIADAVEELRATLVAGIATGERLIAQTEAMASHVEAKAAAMMRRGHAPQHAVLVINNADGPCGWLRGRQGKQRYGTSCDELFADALPADSTLTVRWRDSSGVERSQVYRGTGRSIRS